MPSLPSALVAIAVLAVAVALAARLPQSVAPGAGERSQRLMRWRVGLQLLAIALVVVVLLARMHR